MGRSTGLKTDSREKPSYYLHELQQSLFQHHHEMVHHQLKSPILIVRLHIGAMHICCFWFDIKDIEENSIGEPTRIFVYLELLKHVFY